MTAALSYAIDMCRFSLSHVAQLVAAVDSLGASTVPGKSPDFCLSSGYSGASHNCDGERGGSRTGRISCTSYRLSMEKTLLILA